MTSPGRSIAVADEKQEFEDDQDDGYRHPGALARTGGVEGLPKAEALESVRENTSFYMRNWLWERLDEKFLLHLKFHPPVHQHVFFRVDFGPSVHIGWESLTEVERARLTREWGRRLGYLTTVTFGEKGQEARILVIWGPFARLRWLGAFLWCFRVNVALCLVAAGMYFLNGYVNGWYAWSSIIPALSFIVTLWQLVRRAR